VGDLERRTKLYGPMSMEITKQLREELLREASKLRLERTLRTDRNGRATPRWISTAGLELARIAGRVRKSSRLPNSAG